MGRHLARRLHWRAEMAASEERHRAILPATVTPPPQPHKWPHCYGDERGRAGKQTQAAPMASELVGGAARCGGSKQTGGGRRQRPDTAGQHWQSCFYIFALMQLHAWAERGREEKVTPFPPCLPHLTSTQPQSLERWEETDRNKPQSQRPIKVLQTPRKSGEAAASLMSFTGCSRVTLWLLKNEINSNK